MEFNTVRVKSEVTVSRKKKKKFYVNTCSKTKEYHLHIGIEFYL